MRHPKSDLFKIAGYQPNRMQATVHWCGLCVSQNNRGTSLT
jgi:hypothetical protein